MNFFYIKFLFLLISCGNQIDVNDLSKEEILENEIEFILLNNYFEYGIDAGSNRPNEISGKPLLFSISPSLPTGLSFNTSTGEISGIPSELSSLREYIITIEYLDETKEINLFLGVRFFDDFDRPNITGINSENNYIVNPYPFGYHSHNLADNELETESNISEDFVNIGNLTTSFIQFDFVPSVGYSSAWAAFRGGASDYNWCWIYENGGSWVVDTVYTSGNLNFNLIAGETYKFGCEVDQNDNVNVYIDDLLVWTDSVSSISGTRPNGIVGFGTEGSSIVDNLEIYLEKPE